MLRSRSLLVGKNLARPLTHSIRCLATKESPLQTAFKMSEDEDEDVRYRTQKNPVIPNVEELPKRWNKMDAGQQDDIIAYLEDRMRGNWKDLTGDEKRALWYIYYGPWGARSNTGEPGAGYAYFAGVVAVLLGGVSAYKLAYPSVPESE